jgi:hypothetical protein
MSTPIQFESQDAFEQAVSTFLKNKLSFSVSSTSSSAGYGDHQEIKTHRVDVQLDDVTITEFYLD